MGIKAIGIKEYTGHKLMGGRLHRCHSFNCVDISDGEF